MYSTLLLWQEAAGGAAPNPLFWPFMLVALAIFYFFMIRPQVKEQKEQKSFSDGLKRGKKVVTVGGLHGTIVGMEDKTITLLIAPKTNITVQRASISLELTKAVYGESTTKPAAKATEKA